MNKKLLLFFTCISMFNSTSYATNNKDDETATILFKHCLNICLKEWELQQKFITKRVMQKTFQALDNGPWYRFKSFFNRNIDDFSIEATVNNTIEEAHKQCITACVIRLEKYKKIKNNSDD